MALSAPTLVSHEGLALGRLLGKGGFSLCYDARHPAFGLKPVACKVLVEVPQVDKATAERLFLAEAALTSSVRHRHVVRCYAIMRLPANYPGARGVTYDTWAMLMELCEGGTLKHAIAMSATGAMRYSTPTALRWLLDTAVALTALHAAEPPIIHRDVKADNVLLSAQGAHDPHRPDSAGVGLGDAAAGAAAAAAGGEGAGDKLVAKLGDLGLHVRVENDRSVMIRRRSISANTLPHLDGSDASLSAAATPFYSVCSRSNSRSNSAAPSLRGAAPSAPRTTPVCAPQPAPALAGSAAAPAAAVPAHTPAAPPAGDRPGASEVLMCGTLSMQRGATASGRNALNPALDGSGWMPTAPHSHDDDDVTSYGDLDTSAACAQYRDDSYIAPSSYRGLAEALGALEGGSSSLRKIERGAEPSAGGPVWGASSELRTAATRLAAQLSGQAQMNNGSDVGKPQVSSLQPVPVPAAPATSSGPRYPPRWLVASAAGAAPTAVSTRTGVAVAPAQALRGASKGGSTPKRGDGSVSAPLHRICDPASCPTLALGSSKGGAQRGVLCRGALTASDAVSAQPGSAVSAASGLTLGAASRAEECAPGGGGAAAAGAASAATNRCGATSSEGASQPPLHAAPAAAGQPAPSPGSKAAAEPAAQSPAAVAESTAPVAVPCAAADGPAGQSSVSPVATLQGPSVAQSSSVGSTHTTFAVLSEAALVNMFHTGANSPQVAAAGSAPEAAGAAAACAAKAGRAATASRAASVKAMAEAERTDVDRAVRGGRGAAEALKDAGRAVWALEGLQAAPPSARACGGAGSAAAGPGRDAAACEIEPEEVQGSVGPAPAVPPLRRVGSISGLLAQLPQQGAEPGARAPGPGSAPPGGEGGGAGGGAGGAACGAAGAGGGAAQQAGGAAAAVGARALELILGAAQLPRHQDFSWVFGLTGRAGSAMYMAPEVFMRQPYNVKVDVFSFGVLAYELLSRQLLILSMINTSMGDQLGVRDPLDYARKVSEGYRPPRTPRISAQAWSLIESCWQQDPCQRPSMAQVVERLRDALRVEVDAGYLQQRLLQVQQQQAQQAAQAQGQADDPYQLEYEDLLKGRKGQQRHEGAPPLILASEYTGPPGCRCLIS